MSISSLPSLSVHRVLLYPGWLHGGAFGFAPAGEGEEGGGRGEGGGEEGGGGGEWIMGRYLVLVVSVVLCEHTPRLGGSVPFPC